MSVLDLNGVANPAERKRLMAQANQEMGNAGLGKMFAIIIPVSIAANVIRDMDWTSAISPGTPTSKRIYGWIGTFVIWAIGFVMAYQSRRSERKAALVEILRSARRCTGCGYPIDEAPETICPECGTARGHA